MDKEMDKVLVIGLDGINWQMINKLVEEDNPQTFVKLMKEGVRGNLSSVIPASTGSAWTSFATGKKPANHGCFEFILPQSSFNEQKVINSGNIKGITFYEILDDNRKKCIIINLPISYPPRINGIIVPDWSASCDDKIFPSELEEEIPELWNYRAFPAMSLLAKNKLVEYIKDIEDVEKKRFEAAKKLFKKEWDFFFILFSGTDWIQHILYDKLVSGEEISTLTKLYHEIDGYIKWFADNSSQDTTVLVMSDHGFKAYNGAFNTNAWLIKNEYLKLEPGTEPIPKLTLEEDYEKAELNKLNIRLPRLILENLSNYSWAKTLYRKITNFLPITVKVNIDLQPKLSETIAYCGGSGSNYGFIYINRKGRFESGIVDKEDYETIRGEIIEKLDLLKEPDGEKAVAHIWKGEDIYLGDCVDKAPDIVFMLDNYRVIASSGSPVYFTDKEATGSGCNAHSLYGVFIAYGSNIKNGVEIQDACIIDLAPTILHVLGIPVPKDMDGRVLKEIFKQGSELAKRPIVYQKMYEEKRMIKSRISNMKRSGGI